MTVQSIAFVVSYAGGSSSEVVCVAADFVAFEEHFDKSISALESGRLTYLYWLAWHSLTRTKKVTASFDEWIGECVGIEPKDSAEDEIPPLGSNQLTG